MSESAAMLKCQCPGCGAVYRVRADVGGKSGKCRQCGGRIAVPVKAPIVPEVPAVSPTVTVPQGTNPAGALLKELLTSFQGEFPRPRVTLGHRLAALLVVCVMLVLPALYLGFAAGVAWLTYWHAVHDVVWMKVPGTRIKAAAACAYLGLIAVGALWFLSLLKPLFLRMGGQPTDSGLSRSDEPVLYCFADKLADLVGAPRPDIIRLDLNVNAAASFDTGLLGLRRKAFVLTLGIPLVAGMSLPQLAGIIAHEFGHFSQRGSTLLNRLIARINLWFAAAVYRHDLIDDAVESMTDSEGHAGTILFGFITWALVSLGRGVLWCLMQVGLLVSGGLSRRMEFDADRYEIGLIGSTNFRASSRRLVELTVADALTREYVFSSLDASHLPDNCPAFIAGLADRSKRVGKKARKLIDDERGKWFTTHPTTRSRIDAAERLNLPGIFNSPHPAKVLFRDFDKNAQSLTQFLYLVRFGPGGHDKLRPTDEALEIYVQTMDNAPERRSRKRRGTL